MANKSKEKEEVVKTEDIDIPGDIKQFLQEKPEPQKMLAKIEPPPPDSGERNLRFLAGELYTMNLDSISIKDLHKDEHFKDIDFDIFQKWACTDKWVQRRKQFQEHWKSKVEKVIGDKIAKSRINELTALQGLSDGIRKMLGINVDENGEIQYDEPELKAKSFEGVVKAWIDLSNTIEARRDKLATIVGGNLVTSAPETNLKPTLTQEEARAAALAIMEARLKSANEPPNEGTPNG